MMKINEKFYVRRDSLFILRKLMSIEMKKKVTWTERQPEIRNKRQSKHSLSSLIIIDSVRFNDKNILLVVFLKLTIFDNRWLI